MHFASIRLCYCTSTYVEAISSGFRTKKLLVNSGTCLQLDEITSVCIKLDGEIFKEQEYPDPIPLFVRKAVEEDDNEDNDE